MLFVKTIIQSWHNSETLNQWLILTANTTLQEGASLFGPCVNSAKAHTSYGPLLSLRVFVLVAPPSVNTQKEWHIGGSCSNVIMLKPTSGHMGEKFLEKHGKKNILMLKETARNFLSIYKTVS